MTSQPETRSEPDDERRLSFIVAGVQKGGTTSLFRTLAKHPQIARPARKELHFFDDDKVDWRNPDYSAYHRRFTWSDTAVVAGESTPSYVWWPGAMERIRDYNPDMRLVFSFRDPVERAFSQWCMEFSRRENVRGFAEAIRAVRPRKWPHTAKKAGNPARAFVGRGYYGAQLARVRELFPPEQILVLDFHRAFVDREGTLGVITDLVGIDRFAKLPRELRSRSQPDAINSAPPTADDVAMLAKLYAKDLAEFGRISGLDISSWPTTRVLAGRLSPAEFAARLAGKTTFVQDAVPAAD